MFYSVIDEYITNQEDTIYKIANKFYFRWYLWRIIYDPNIDVLGSDPYSIPAGKKIKILGINTEPENHTVNDGDTWYSLAKDYYGSGSRHWIDIAIKNSYKHLLAGETVIIPALVTAEDMKKARDLRSVCS